MNPLPPLAFILTTFLFFFFYTTVHIFFAFSFSLPPVPFLQTLFFFLTYCSISFNHFILCLSSSLSLLFFFSFLFLYLTLFFFSSSPDTFSFHPLISPFKLLLRQPMPPSRRAPLSDHFYFSFSFSSWEIVSAQIIGEGRFSNQTDMKALSLKQQIKTVTHLSLIIT